MKSRIMSVVLVASLVTVGLSLGGYAATGPVLVSANLGGTVGNSVSRGASISGDGRYVAFESLASDLVPTDTNANWDVFVRDLSSGTTELASVTTAGAQVSGQHGTPAISADGRFVAFQSNGDMVPGDPVAGWNIYVHDRVTGETTRASVATDGAPIGGYLPTISGDGRYVGFYTSLGSRWVGYLRDRQSGTTELVTVTNTGGTPNGDCFLWSISADGRFAAFSSNATNLVSGDTNGQWDVFVRDRLAGTTTRVSVSSSGQQAVGGRSEVPVLSADGRYLAFRSWATNLVAGDTNGLGDIFVHDRQSGSTTRVSVSSSGSQALGGDSFVPAVSADGRFVVFSSAASNLVSGDTNAWTDVFVHDSVTGDTTRISDGPGKVQTAGDIYASGIADDGRTAFFSTDASNVVAGDTNGGTDVFVVNVPGSNVGRLAGTDRYGTAVALSKRGFPSGASKVFVAVGSNFPDALGAGPVAAAEGAPLLLVGTDSVPGMTAAELSRLNPSEIVVVGGTGVISAGVQSALLAFVP